MTTVKGSWELQDVRDKALAGIWKEYDSSGDPFTMFMWGRNTQGNLGQNNLTNYSSPVQVTGTTWSRMQSDNYATLANKVDGTLWAWGDNNKGQLGQNESGSTDRSSPVQIPGTTWTRPFAINDNQAGCIKSDNTMWMWGHGEEGTLASNNRTNYSSPIQVPGSWSLAEDAANVGMHATKAIKTDGTLWAWGANGYGTLGQNSRNNYSSPMQIGSATNWNYVARSWGGAFAINTSGELYAWGSNFYGCLGINANGADSTARSSPVQIPGTTWKSAYGGTVNTAGLKTDGTLWTWGSNDSGQLGQNNRTQYSSPVQVPGTTWTKAKSMYAGTIAQKSDGTLWVMGYNDYGSLGQNNRVKYSSPVQIPGTTWDSSVGGNANFMARKPA